MSTEQSIDWRGLVGFEHAFSRFKDLRVKNRIPPVLLLEGHEGIGKTRLAAGVAALYVCEAGVACGECSACKDVRNLRHDDVFWLQEEKLKLEHAAELQDHLQYNPGHISTNSSAVRLAVGIDIDKLVPQAANRLLKILEEPPPQARVILTTSHYQNLLDTIKSRCVKWHLRLPTSLAGDPRSDLSEELADDLEAFLSIEQDNKALVQAQSLQKKYNLSPAELIKFTELALNRLYRKKLTAEPNSAQVNAQRIRNRRRNLQDLHRLAERQKIALNPQLSLESLGGVGIGDK